MTPTTMTATDELIAREDAWGAHNYHPLDLVIDHAEGAWVTDVEGTRYLDCLSSYSAVNQGHCHPRILATLVEQASRVTLTSRAFRNDQLGPFCEELAQLCGMEMVLPMNTGAEAVEGPGHPVLRSDRAGPAHPGPHAMSDGGRHVPGLLLEPHARWLHDGVVPVPPVRCPPMSDRQLISSGSPFEAVMGYSRAVRVGDRVVLAGTAAQRPDGTVDEDPGDQTRRCLEIIGAALEQAGATFADVVRTRMFLTSAEDFDAVAKAHGEVFADVRPANTTVVVAALLDPRWKIELEVEAVVGSGSAG